MRIYSIVATTFSGVLMASISTIAFAGSCDNGKCNSDYNTALAPYEGVPNAVCRTSPSANNRVSTCSVRSVVNPGAAAPLAPINYYYSTPYGYLNTFAYKNTPNVNIMQIYARPPMAALNNVPIRFSRGGFAGGCNTVAMGSCVRNAIIAAPIPVPGPVSGPVTALAPTVQRTPVLPIAPAAPIAPVQYQASNAYTSANVIGHVSGGSYITTKPGTPDYWEKTSGATVVSGMPATQIVCRRAGTAATNHTVNVVRPVIGVPTPVPTPLPYCLPRQGVIAPVASGGPVAMAMTSGRWTQ